MTAKSAISSLFLLAACAHCGGSAPRERAPAPSQARAYVYVGGYSESDPFRVFALDRDTLALREVRQDADVGPQPTYICPSADGRFLYVANESDAAGGITALQIDPATGIPIKINRAPAIDAGYVFTTLDPTGKLALATSYNGGNLGVYSVAADGALGARVAQQSFGGSAQSHSVRVHPSGKWAFVPNRGLDAVAQLVLDSATGTLTPNPAAAAYTRATPAFDGPRHIAFSPDGALAFVILELANELTSFAVERGGTLREVDRKPRLPAGFTAEDSGAHVLAHPHGRFVYGSNRGSDTIVAFSYDATGALTLLEHEPSGGRTPRNFDIDRRGQLMVVANQEATEGSGGSLTVFVIERDGRLTPRGAAITGLDSPAAVAIVSL